MVDVLIDVSGEDGEEMSAAGQMETILGVIGKTQVCDPFLIDIFYFWNIYASLRNIFNF
jgi:hypothetical protein